MLVLRKNVGLCILEHFWSTLEYLNFLRLRLLNPVCLFVYGTFSSLYIYMGLYDYLFWKIFQPCMFNRDCRLFGTLE